LQQFAFRQAQWFSTQLHDRRVPAEGPIDEAALKTTHDQERRDAHGNIFRAGAAKRAEETPALKWQFDGMCTARIVSAICDREKRARQLLELDGCFPDYASR